MAKVVLDTNIVIDYLSATRAHHADAVELLEMLLMQEDGAVLVPAGCIKDAYYILCRHYESENVARTRLDSFRRIVDVVELTNPILGDAFASDEPDLEDAIVRATAERAGADAIATRDASTYASSPVASMSARAFCDDVRKGF